LAPDLTSLTMLELRPIAAMAMMIMNLLSSFKGRKTLAFTPLARAKVVIKEARTK
jgi:hypothetical protein